MKDEHNFPLAYKRLQTIKKFIENAETKAALNRFTYRYRIARAFEAIVAPQVGERTTSGYAAGMKLLLAYSAFDEIRQARNSFPKLKPKQGEYTKIIKSKLAEKLRNNKDLENLLSTEPTVKNSALKKDIAAFFANKNDDVMCIATALRNTFAHGVFTAAGAGLTTKRRQQNINELTIAVLEMTDEIAIDCVEQLEAMRKVKNELSK